MSKYVNNEKRNVLTPEYLNECFRYEDGRLYWRFRPRYHFQYERIQKGFNTVFAGKEAFQNINKSHGYHQGCVNRHMTLRRWAVFVMMKGYVPVKSIKSYNDDRTDDRIENLYEHGSKDEFMNVSRVSDNEAR